MLVTSQAEEAVLDALRANRARWTAEARKRLERSLARETDALSAYVRARQASDVELSLVSWLAPGAALQRPDPRRGAAAAALWRAPRLRGGDGCARR